MVSMFRKDRYSMVTLGLTILMGAAALATSSSGNSCAKPDTPAVVNVQPAMVPPILLVYDGHGTSNLIVTLDPKSEMPAKVDLVQPSGDAILDSAAMQMAKKTHFTTETQSCVAVGGRYFYDVIF